MKDLNFLELDPNEREARVKDAEENITTLIVASETVRQRKVRMSDSYSDNFFKGLQKYLV